jgi:hypothetical protein
MTGDDVRDARDVFLAAVAELGRVLPDPGEAADRLVHFYAACITEGRITAISGARAIAAVGRQLPDLMTPTMQRFDGLDDEWIGGFGRTRADVEAAIRVIAAEVARP